MSAKKNEGAGVGILVPKIFYFTVPYELFLCALLWKTARKTSATAESVTHTALTAITAGQQTPPRAARVNSPLSASCRYGNINAVSTTMATSARSATKWGA